jgi:aspartate racemase
MFMLKSRVRRLSQLPMSCIGIACNTAHTTLTDLEKISNTPFISIPKEVAKEAIRKKYHRLGLMATPTTIHSGVYQSILIKEGIEVVTPDYQEVELLGRVVGQIVNGEFKAPKKQLLIIADKLKKQKLDALVLGCTEIPLVFPKNYSLSVLDSVEILARALLKRYYERRSSVAKALEGK